MASLVIPNVVQCRLIWTRGGQDHGVNVIHFLKPGGTAVNTALANTVANVLRTNAVTTVAGTTYASWLCTPYQLNRVSLRDLDQANQPEIFNNDGPIMTGTSTAAPLPPATALVTTLRTSLAGKSFRGRIYGMGYGETGNDALGDPLPALAARQTAFWAQNISTFATTTTLDICVASRKLLNAKEALTCDTNVLWDTQRRRNRPGI